MGTKNRQHLNPSRGDSLNRRSFLKVGTLGSVLPLAALSPERSSNSANSQGGASRKSLQALPPGHKTLPPIPGLNDLASDRLVYHYRDLFNPPEAMTTCELYLNGRLLNSYPPPAGRVAYTRYPHRVPRETEVEACDLLPRPSYPRSNEPRQKP